MVIHLDLVTNKFEYLQYFKEKFLTNRQKSFLAISQNFCPFCHTLFSHLVIDT